MRSMSLSNAISLSASDSETTLFVSANRELYTNLRSASG